MLVIRIPRTRGNRAHGKRAKSSLNDTVYLPLGNRGRGIHIHQTRVDGWGRKGDPKHGVSEHPLGRHSALRATR